MARARGLKEYGLPMQGFNTEVNVLNFPQEFAVDCLNVEPDYDPQTLRPRKGLERSGVPRLADTRTTGDNEIALSSFLWSSVNRDALVNFIVVQIGRYLDLYDDSLLNSPTTGGLVSRLDLNSVLSGTTEGTLANVEKTRLSYANVKGKLMITSPYIDPSLLSYDGTTLEIAKMSLKMRDLQGVSDGLDVENRPFTLSDDHKYNILNQGWYKSRRSTAGSSTVSDPISAFFSAKGIYPANSDIAWLGMTDVAGDLIFDPDAVSDQTFGNTSAPKGHYIVDVFSKDRNAIIVDPSVSGNSTSGSFYSSIPVDGTNIPPASN